MAANRAVMRKSKMVVLVADFMREVFSMLPTMCHLGSKLAKFTRNNLQYISTPTRIEPVSNLYLK